MSEECVFCDIAAGRQPATLVYENDLTIAFLDLRQHHPGHTLVIPRRHIHDVRDLDDATGAAVMTTVCRITRAVAAAFHNDGLSLWHSIGLSCGRADTWSIIHAVGRSSLVYATHPPLHS